MDSKDLGDYLEDLARKTTDGVIVWERVNSSIYKWTQGVDGDQYLITIQKASAPIVVGNTRRVAYSYLLQIHMKSKSEAIVTISSKERPDFKDALASVFSGAERSTDLIAKSVLSKLLGN